MKKNIKKTKIVLINFVNNELRSCDFPIGLYTLKSYLLKRYGSKCDVKIKDFQIEKFNDILNFTVSYEPDILGLSLMLRSFHICEIFLKKFYMKISEKKEPLLVFGKNIATFAPKELLKKYNNAICVIGEGELALGGLVKYVNNQQDLSLIPNLMYYKKSKFFKTEFKLLEDLELLGEIDYSNAGKYVKQGGVLWVESSRGCPWSNCTFCSTKAYWKKVLWRRKPIKMIVNEFKYIHNVLKIKNIILTDEEFFGDMFLTRELAIALEKENLLIKFYINLRVNDIYNEKDDKERKMQRIETLLYLKEAGLKTVYLGVETGSSTQLKRYNKGTTIREAECAIKICEELKFNIQIGWLMFEPFLTLTELRDNLSFLSKNNILKYLSTPLNQILIYPSIPYYKMIRNYEKKLNRKLISDNIDVEYLTYDIVDYKHKEIKKIVGIMNKYRRLEYSLYNCIKWFVRFDPQAFKNEYSYLNETLVKIKKYQISLVEKLAFLNEYELTVLNKGISIYYEIVEQRKELVRKLKEKVIANNHLNKIEKIVHEIDSFLEFGRNYSEHRQNSYKSNIKK